MVTKADGYVDRKANKAMINNARQMLVDCKERGYVILQQKQKLIE